MIAILALVSAALALRHHHARDDGEMLQRQIELQWLQELSRIENQQQVFWREHGVLRSDLVGVGDTILYDRSHALLRTRFGERLKPLARLDSGIAAAFERLSEAAAGATRRHCQELLPKMKAELVEMGLPDGNAPGALEIQRRWMLLCRARCTAEMGRLAETHTPSVDVVRIAERRGSLDRQPSQIARD